MMSSSNYWTEMLCKFGITNHDHIIVYDNSYLHSGCRLWFALKYFGHEKVSVLNGGFQKWLKEEKPITNMIDKIEQTESYETNENNDWIKNKKQINENIKNNSFVLVDGRNRERFEGKAIEPRPGLITGCIPGSKNIPFVDFVRFRVGFC